MALQFRKKASSSVGHRPQGVAAVCTYGDSRTTSFLLGDPPKRVVKRLVRSMPGHAVRCDYLANYDMDHSNPEQRAAFLEKVKRTFESW
jgi:NAD(P)H dehydrogenase (quinone)